MMTTIAKIADAVEGAALSGPPDVLVTGAAHDSRQVKPGDLFAVIRGEALDGVDFVDAAIEKGAVALLVDQLLPVDIPQVIVKNVRNSLGPVAAACFGNPTEKLQVIAITGTNGKTTSAYLVEAALLVVGEKPGVMSTVEYRYGSRRLLAPHTTPESTVVQSVVDEMVREGTTHLVMEASSHGIVMGRLGGCSINVAAFTNLTQDHLDFHKDMDEYGAAKLQLFTNLIAREPDARIVVNGDDPFSKTIIQRAVHPYVVYSTRKNTGAQIHPIDDPQYSIAGIEAKLTTPRGECLIQSPLIGQHNLSNLLGALGVCMQLDMAPDVACKALGTVQVVPGRLECIPSKEPFSVFVDYAHTPDALHRVLMALRPLTEGRLIAVFGCGGDRDPSKRSIMGKAVGKEADVAIVTSDNPRTEDPNSILEMIIRGIDVSGMGKVSLEQIGDISRGYAVEVDRRVAIGVAIRSARPGDTVLIAGKGHEDYQILGTEKIHFDDREEARGVLGTMGGKLIG
jgi:UDP-N-acetylmuramoyl-L-alanyl-D-glutamate--2,6-diaminopimelate ligase